MGGKVNGLLDRCISCGRPAKMPGGGQCLQCEIMALIDLSFDRMRAALSGAIPITGRRLSKLQKGANTTQVTHGK
jgi:hypothetical protein